MIAIMAKIDNTSGTIRATKMMEFSACTVAVVVTADKFDILLMMVGLIVESCIATTVC